MTDIPHLKDSKIINPIKGVCISARESSEFLSVEKMILKEAPNTKIISFENVLLRPDLLEQSDKILTVGGDGSVAWLIGTIYKALERVDILKPIVPVIRPNSIGYLRQLDLQPEETFREGFRSILNGEYRIQHRAILKTTIFGQNYIGVNEIYLHCDPYLGKYRVWVENIDHPTFELLTDTMADGLMISTAMGSTAWALSHGGMIDINEDALELVFVGGVHSTSNFIINRRRIKIELTLKNPAIIKETIGAYNEARARIGLEKDPVSSKTLELVYGSRVVIDGKIMSFGVTELEIDPSLSAPLLVLERETVIAKARELTKIPKYRK